MPSRIVNQQFYRPLILGLVVVLALHAALLGSQMLAFARWGTHLGLAVASMLVGCLTGLAIAAPILLLIALATRRGVQVAVAGVVLATVHAMLLAVVTAPLERHIRRSAFEDLAARSRPLIAAIRTYERENGEPPQDLQALVPAYLDAVPWTGYGAYQRYIYLVGEDAAEFQRNWAGLPRGEADPWLIYVFTPNHGLNFDTFLYVPSEDYASRSEAGAIERIDGWAYVDE